MKVAGFVEGKPGEALIMMNALPPEGNGDYIMAAWHTLAPAL